ncbi:MAG TPA: hypothetical protein VHN77_06720 [Phycisphaerales bacterium]|nr:hypothetical protein [Phycisphaerales bacterium]
MRPHPRIRKTIKWGGLVIAGLLSVAWVGSKWFFVGWSSPAGGFVYGGAGLICVATPLWTDAQAMSPQWRFERHSDSMRWWFHGRRWPLGHITYCPLWFPLLLVLIPTALAWRLDSLVTRRARLSLRPKDS